MDYILQGIPRCLCYLDDLLITVENEKEYITNLEEVLKCLEAHGIQFMKDSVDYLGYVIDAKGLHVSHRKVQAVLDALKPNNQRKLHSFLGLLQYYGKFIPNLSTH